MLFTIGYEKAKLEDFIGTLQHAGVDVLVDVRDRAQSRRKGFSKTALSEALKDHGIDYLHLRALGDPKEGREAARSGQWEKFRKIYGNVVSQPPATEALSTVKELLNDRKVCLMCYERNHAECHRAIVTTRLNEQSGISAQHLGVQSIDPVRPLRNCCEGATA